MSGPGEEMGAMLEAEKQIRRLRAREETARRLILLLRSVVRTKGKRPLGINASIDVEDWLDGEWFAECTMCGSRHRSDDRHPCE